MHTYLDSMCICESLYIYIYVYTVCIYIYGRPPPPHVPTLFGVFLWPKTVRCVLAVLFRSRNQSNTLQSRTIAQNQKNQNQKKQKKQNQKKQKHNYFRTLPFVYIFKRLFWKSSEIMFFLFFWVLVFWFPTTTVSIATTL